MADASKFQLVAGGPVYTVKDEVARQRLTDLLDNPNAKNGIARGKNIQTYFNNGKLFDRIADGSFDDLFIGDYWQASYNGVTKTFRIAGFNTFYGNGCGDCPEYLFITPHAVIVPDEYLGEDRMNGSDTTVGGYLNSYMNKTVIGAVATAGGTTTVNQKLYSIFGSHLLTHYEELSSSIDANATSRSGMGWTGSVNGTKDAACQAVLMSEIELYGTNIFSSSGEDDRTVAGQLPLFQLMPKTRTIRGYSNSDDVPDQFGTDWYWLRNVASSKYFSYHMTNTGCMADIASDPGLLRPRFLIG